MRHLRFFWGLLISVVILTSSSNHSRRFLSYFFMTFHDLLLVSNETTKLAHFTVNTKLIDFVAFTFFI